MAEIGIDGVMAAKPIFADRSRVNRWLDALARAIKTGDRAAAERVFEEAIPEFKRRTQTIAPAPASPSGVDSRLPSEAPERLRARDERAGEPLERFLAARQAPRRPAEQARRHRERGRRAAEPGPQGGDHLGHRERFGVGDDEGAPDRTVALQQRRRPPPPGCRATGASAAPSGAPSGSGQGDRARSSSAAMLPFTPGP